MNWLDRGRNKAPKLFQIGCFLVVAIVANGCDRHSNLRIRNAGDVSFKRVVVLFPDTRVEFADLPAGSTSEYRVVGGGVGDYAAFEFDLDNGGSFQQPVVDFVGWTPLRGNSFTYEIRLTEGRSQPFLDVTRVVKDR